MAMFRTHNRKRSDSLQELVQDLENMVHKAYTGASEDVLTVLLPDKFTDVVNIHRKVQLIMFQQFFYLWI